MMTYEAESDSKCRLLPVAAFTEKAYVNFGQPELPFFLRKHKVLLLSLGTAQENCHHCTFWGYSFSLL